MIEYIKKNRFLFLLSIFSMITIFLSGFFLLSKFFNEKYFILMKNTGAITELNSHSYSFWEYFYNSGKAVTIQNIINRLGDIENKKSVFQDYIKKFFNNQEIQNQPELSSDNHTNSANTSLINNFYYFNLYLQLSVFCFTLFCILCFFNTVITINLFIKYIIIAKKFNFYKLWIIILFNFPGFISLYFWEKNLFFKNHLLLEEAKFIKKSKLIKIFHLIKNRYQSFNTYSTKDLVVIENLSFKPNIKHSIFKHLLDIYKLVKFRKDIKEKEHLYEQKSLFKNKEDKYILKNINLTIKSNSFNIIIGPNGSGKTTLIKSLINLNENFLGSILWKGIELSKINKKEFAQNVSYIPQFLNINYEINVFNFLLLTRMPYKKIYSDSTLKDEEVVLKAIRDSGCIEFADKKMNELSGGQQQKVLLASILTQQSEIIILDEPTVFLDMKNQYFLLNSLKKFHSMGKTIIMILHDLQQAIDYASNLIVMKDGTIYSSGEPKKIINEKLLSDVFEINSQIINNNEKFEIQNIQAI